MDLTEDATEKGDSDIVATIPIDCLSSHRRSWSLSRSCLPPIIFFV